VANEKSNVSFCVRPFVYKEILEYTRQLGKDCSITDYLVYGGFPKRFEFPDQETVTAYLNDLNQTIIINDIPTLQISADGEPGGITR